jgi:hypothetical protein
MYQDFVLCDANRQKVEIGRVNHDCGKNGNAYQANGYKNRADYLSELSDQYGVPMYVVSAFAEMLGANEDFDSLVSTLEDHSMMFAS